MPRGPKGVPMLVGAACSRQCERWVYERDFKDALSLAALNKPPILRPHFQAAAWRERQMPVQQLSER
jgi:hypothetical protein